VRLTRAIARARLIRTRVLRVAFSEAPVRTAISDVVISTAHRAV